MTKIQLVNYEAVQLRINQLGKKVKDFEPVWKEFIKVYQEDTIKNMDTGGIGTNDTKWTRYTDKYSKRKKRGRKIPDLKLSGVLRDAIKGGPGWSAKISGKSLNMSINLPYAAIHQYGHKEKKIPARPYFFRKDGRIMARSLASLYKILLKYLGILLGTLVYGISLIFFPRFNHYIITNLLLILFIRKWIKKIWRIICVFCICGFR